MNYVDKCRVLLVGDPGVGKTSLANLLSQNESTRGSKWTVGCNVDIKLHTHKKTNKQYFIEFIDVAGSCKHRKSRQLFYKNLDGIILVYDLLNSKSHSNLWKWCTEVLNSEYMTKASNSKSKKKLIELKIH
ncbi:hypothetical protein HK099_006981 [Clydaea vesicula]|uniref:Uncharacterized protein n=1 Tax=Clydaea vesicula TaxID=447962 RepID=A0AAD5Y2W1_9FUNG|nr:hypothetical protein HK099_006981 [Clydaea vesicula]